jgi:ankyrin repeat protein
VLRAACILLVVVMSAIRVVAGADSRVVEAARRQDPEKIRALLQQRVDVNVAQADGATALHWAAHWNDVDTADLLLRAGADPNAANELGVTPLSLACTNASAAMVQRLLQAGANPNAKGARVAPLMTCARTGSVEAVRALIARKADVNAREPLRDQTALMWAVSQKRADVARVLIEHGADVRARSRLSRVVVNRANPNDIYAAVVGTVSQGGSTPLLFAARQGDVESARLLLASGANVNDLLPDGTSALTVAAHSNHAPLVQLLLDRGANPNIIGSGYTALHAAVLRGNAGSVRALVARGAVINSRLRHGTPTTRGSREFFLPESLTGATPVWLAARFLEQELLRLLLERGADPSLTLQDGTTMLMAAAGVGSQATLFDRRERIAALKDSDEPLAVPIVKLLIERGADVNGSNELGDTALHGAAKMNYPIVARMLVERGARLEARNKKGETPLAVAGGDEVKNVLRTLGAKLFRPDVRSPLCGPEREFCTRCATA